MQPPCCRLKIHIFGNIYNLNIGTSRIRTSETQNIDFQKTENTAPDNRNSNNQNTEKLRNIKIPTHR